MKSAPNMRDRVIAAMGDASEMDRHTLARLLWPPDDFPRAWGYAAHGGPPNWVRAWGAAVKRHGIKEYQINGRWMVRRPLPNRTKQGAPDA